MNTYTTNAELQSVVMDKLGKNRRERVKLSPRRRDGISKMAHTLISLIF